MHPREDSGSGGARYLLSSHYSQGLAKSLKPGETFTSFRTCEMPHDSDDAERQGLARRKMCRSKAQNVHAPVNVSCAFRLCDCCERC